MLLSFWLPIKKQLNNDQQYLAVSVCRYKRSSLKCRKHVYWKVNEKKRQKTSNEVNNWQYIILRSTCFSGSKISTVSSHKINIGQLRTLIFELNDCFMVDIMEYSFSVNYVKFFLLIFINFECLNEELKKIDLELI